MDDATQAASAERNAILRELRSINSCLNWFYFLLVMIVATGPAGDRIWHGISAIFSAVWSFTLGLLFAAISHGH